MLLHDSVHREDDAEPVTVHREAVVGILHDFPPHLIGIFILMYSIDNQYIIIIGKQIRVGIGEFFYSDFNFFFIVVRKFVEYFHIERIDERGMQMELPLPFEKISYVASVHQFLTNLETVAPNLMK